MYNSIKSWLNLPAIIKPFESRSGTGAKTFGASISILCYAEGTIKIITDKDGKEVKSMKQLYVDGNTSISERDNIIFEGKETEINAIGYFYRSGVVDLKVVYL